MLSLYKSKSKIAVYDNDRPYTYEQVNCTVEKMMSYIHKYNVKKVAMHIEQGFFNYCLEWAAYLSGITFCCYDVDAPLERIKYCNDNFCPDIVVTNNNLEGIQTISFEEMLKSDNCNIPYMENKNEVAYVLFTSGSTGLPKGVMVKRIALENVVFWAKNNYSLDDESIYAQYSKNSFDLSVLDVFLGLSSGATLIPFVGINKLLPGRLIYKYKVTHWHSVPSAFIALQNRRDLNAEILSSIKTIVFCGETLYPQLVNSIFEANAKVNLWNTYGPTEATIFCSAIRIDEKTKKIDAHNSISIGQPITKMQFEIDLGEQEGELLIIGENVAKGYLNNLTHSAFFTKTINGKPKAVYRSGDIVKKENGQYYFVCRKDNQVKIAGNRFDLDEITKVIHKLGYHCVSSILLGNLIYTFIQSVDFLSYTVEEISLELKKILPQYGIPSKIIFLDSLPLNSNGKVDKNKLKEIALSKGEN